MEEGRTKEEVLSELYAIRAAMSLVSKNEDEAMPTKRELQGSNYNISHEENNRKESDEYFQRRSNELNEKRKTVEEQNPYIPQSSIRPLLYTGCAFIPALIPLIWGAVVMYCTSPDRKNFFSEGVLLFCIGVAVPLFVFLISCYMKKRNNEHLRAIYTEKFEREKANALCEIDQEIVRITSDHNQTVAHANSVIRKAKETLPLCKQKLTEIVENSKQIIDCAKEAYRVIDYRDWENVDLLIFYFETGRAESLKEALQLVDRQRQTNEIVNAIHYASAQISSSIEISIKKLGKALALSFDRLSAQMQQQHRELLESNEKQQRSVLGKFDELSENMREAANEAVTRKIETEQMQNALLSKIDRSSAELAGDMEKQLKYVHGIFF